MKSINDVKLKAMKEALGVATGVMNDLEYKYWLSVLEAGAGFSGDYDDLTNKPSLGTAASKNIGTGAGDVVLGATLNTKISEVNDSINALATALNDLTDRVAALEP